MFKTKMMFAFYSKDSKIMPYFDVSVADKLRDLKIGNTVVIGNLSFTICTSNDIPDSRNKIGRLGNDIKCVLVAETKNSFET